MKSNLSQLVESRWFPTVSRPLVAGVLTSGLVFGLHAVGVTSFEPHQLNAITTPLAGFLITAIVDIPLRKPAPKGSPTLAQQMEALAVQIAHEELDSNPELIKRLASGALQDALSPAATSPSVQVHIDGQQVLAKPDDPEASGVIR